MTLDNWREAARYNDAEAEEGGVAHVAAGQGVDLDDLIHIAQQRALRVILLEKGLKIQTVNAVSLSTSEQKRRDSLMVVYFDGLLIGWRARGLSDKGGTDG